MKYLVNPNCRDIRRELKHGDNITIFLGPTGNEKIKGRIFIPLAIESETVWVCSNKPNLDGATIPKTLYRGNERKNLEYMYSWCIREIPDCDLIITKDDTQIIKNWGNRKLRKILMEKNII